MVKKNLVGFSIYCPRTDHLLSNLKKFMVYANVTQQQVQSRATIEALLFPTLKKIMDPGTFLLRRPPVKKAPGQYCIHFEYPGCYEELITPWDRKRWVTWVGSISLQKTPEDLTQETLSLMLQNSNGGVSNQEEPHETTGPSTSSAGEPAPET